MVNNHVIHTLQQKVNYLRTSARVCSCVVKKHCCSSIAEWSVHYIAVSCNPANVSGAGKDFTGLIVKVILCCCGNKIVLFVSLNFFVHA